MGELRAALNASRMEIDRFPVQPGDLAELLGLVRDGVLSGSAAKRVFVLMVEQGGEERASQVAEREGLLQVRDETALSSWIDEVIAEHPDEAARCAKGERKLIGVLVGFVMKKSGGRADPKRVNQLLAQRFGA
jgi:aspartyl-tRNA(Asn)/glutamyl-tRNA(Gln) amidotransferase subunit B